MHGGGAEEPVAGLKKRDVADASGGPGGTKEGLHRFTGEDGNARVKHSGPIRAKDDAQGR